MISISAVTNPGSVRDHNEDTLVLPGFISVGTVSSPVSMEWPKTSDLLLAVVDGMGGQRGGQAASRRIGQYLLDHSDEEVASLLMGANRDIYETMRQLPSLTGMGATVAGISVRHLKLIVFNVGDARVYQMVEGYLMLLSTDDRVSAESNLVTQSIGGAERPTGIDPHVVTLDAALGQTILICSDGLSDVVSFDSIQTTLAEYRGSAGLERLLNLALEAGAPDNVSIVAVEFGDE